MTAHRTQTNGLEHIMPHAELKHSQDLVFDAGDVFAAIEETIQRHDPGAGECKGRAYPSDRFRHSHMLVVITMLSKDHRDDAFTKALMADIEAEVKGRLHQDCFFSLLIEYSTSYYVTNTHVASHPD